jgi:hypothetical protein
MSTASWQYPFKSDRRHERLKEIQRYEWWFSIFSWVSALILWGLLWWAAFRLLTVCANLLRTFRVLLP